MKIQLTGTRFGLTPAIHALVERKMGSLARLVRRFESQGEVTAFLEVAKTTKHHKRGPVFYAEATLRLPGKTLRVEEYDADLGTAVDRMKDRLKNDLQKFKERTVDRKRPRRAR